MIFALLRSRETDFFGGVINNVKLLHLGPSSFKRKALIFNATWDRNIAINLHRNPQNNISASNQKYFIKQKTMLMGQLLAQHKFQGLENNPQ